MNFHMLNNKPELFIITETWLNFMINDSDLGLYDYVIYRRDRSELSSSKSEGGGILIAVKKNLDSSLIVIEETKIEQIFIKIKSSKLIIGALYIPPDMSSDYYEAHVKTVRDLASRFENFKIALFGDYNLRSMVCFF